MKRDALEPGLLQVFRWFVAVRLVVLAIAVAAQLARRQTQVLRYPWLGIVGSLVLLGMLSWPWLRRQLGGAYLPLMLSYASLGPILVHAITVGLRLMLGTAGAAATVDAWQLILVLFIPLILTAWQYGVNGIVIFCTATAGLDLFLTVILAIAGRFRPTTTVGLLVVRTLLFGLVGYVVARLMAAQRAQRQALADANARLADYAATLEQLAVSRERNRLARELHDTLAHSLSALAVQLEAVRSVWESDPEAAHRMLERSLAITREGLGEARRAISALRASPLEDLGLVGALRQLAQTMAEHEGLGLDLSLPEDPHVLVGLSPSVEQGLYRIAHEALENATRHARATHLSLALEVQPARLALTVSDDGIGFDPKGAVPDGRYGLRGMRERAEMIGALFTIESRAGKGTRVTVTVEREAEL